ARLRAAGGRHGQPRREPLYAGEERRAGAPRRSARQARRKDIIKFANGGTMKVAVGIAGALLLAGAALAQPKVNLSIATGPTGGVYYPLGGGIANVLSKYVPGYAANAEATAGSVANLQLMSQKKS